LFTSCHIVSPHKTLIYVSLLLGNGSGRISNKAYDVYFEGIRLKIFARAAVNVKDIYVIFLCPSRPMMEGYPKRHKNCCFSYNFLKTVKFIQPLSDWTTNIL
jgi:hypothetical protein